MHRKNLTACNKMNSTHREKTNGIYNIDYEGVYFYWLQPSGNQLINTGIILSKTLQTQRKRIKKKRKMDTAHVMDSWLGLVWFALPVCYRTSEPFLCNSSSHLKLTYLFCNWILCSQLNSNAFYDDKENGTPLTHTQSLPEHSLRNFFKRPRNKQPISD